MVKNEKGFTIIELLAVIVISSIIITPLMFSLVSNVNINALLHIRRSSVSLAEGAIYGFDKLSYSDIETLQENSTSHHLVFDSTSCDQLDTNDESICDIVFLSEFNRVLSAQLYDNIGILTRSWVLDSQFRCFRYC